MPIGISAHHRELAEVFGSWAASRSNLESVRAAEGNPVEPFAESTRALTEMGFAGIAVSEEEGGGGGTVSDVAVAVESMAGALLPGPLLGTAVAGVLSDQGESLATGRMVVAMSLGDLVSVSDGRVSGELSVVWDAYGATHVLVADADGRWWLADLAGAATSPLESPDLTRRAASVHLAGAVAIELPPDRGTHVRDLLTALVAAEASGVAHWCLDQAVAYAKVRDQFGAPIGSFQAIKHLCAEMLEGAESVTAAAWDAARAFDETHASAEEHAVQISLAASVAGAIAVPTAITVAQQCIQVLGGIGFTFEHDAHFYLRRLLALRAMMWPAHAYEQRLAQLTARRRPRLEYADLDPALRAEITSLVASIPADRPRDRLVETGLLVPHWPAPYGRGASPVEQVVIDEELAAAGITRPELKIAGWAVPTIVFHGTPQQQERFVMASLRGEITWCQLFSEPSAGSDLAALRTKAVKVDGGWELTGQKVWTSLAHEADWAICLARTDPDVAQHRGISYFLLDMTSPGITIRPLREMTGDAMFNEVFLDSVFVPDDLMVGRPGDGWSLARATLANERVAMASTNLGISVEEALRLAADGMGPVDLARIGSAVAWARVTGLLSDRASLRSIVGAGPGPESSVAKLVGVRSRQDAASLVMTLLGEKAVLGDKVAKVAVHQQLLTRCLSIAGGTTQVLRNVVAERILGLPR